MSFQQKKKNRNQQKIKFNKTSHYNVYPHVDENRKLQTETQELKYKEQTKVLCFILELKIIALLCNVFKVRKSPVCVRFWLEASHLHCYSKLGSLFGLIANCYPKFTFASRSHLSTRQSAYLKYGSISYIYKYSAEDLIILKI